MQRGSLASKAQKQWSLQSERAACFLARFSCPFWFMFYYFKGGVMSFWGRLFGSSESIDKIVDHAAQTSIFDYFLQSHNLFFTSHDQKFFSICKKILPNSEHFINISSKTIHIRMRTLYKSIIFQNNLQWKNQFWA